MNKTATLGWIAGTLRSMAEHVGGMGREPIANSLRVLSSIAESATAKGEETHDWTGAPLRTARLIGHYTPNKHALLEVPKVDPSPGWEWVGDWRFKKMVAVGEVGNVVIYWERTSRRLTEPVAAQETDGGKSE